jgi:hypothetical protein
VSEFGGSETLNFSGTLAPGQYTLAVVSHGEAGNGDPGISESGSAEHDIALTFKSASTPSGAVPDGDDVPGAPLLITKLDGDLLRLTWSPSCRSTDDDYAVYEGPLGDPLDLAPVTCSTSGATSHDLQPTFDAAVYLVVPTNSVSEGSYGRTSLGDERAPAYAACLAQLLDDPVCPAPPRSAAP